MDIAAAKTLQLIHCAFISETFVAGKGPIPYPSPSGRLLK
jgi:hypothetical protein